MHKMWHGSGGRLGRVWLWLWCAAAMGVSAGVCVAQRAAPTEPYLSGSAGAGGVKVFRPDHWSLAQSRVVNPTDRDQRVRVAFFFRDNTQRQYVRPVWLPPLSTRLVSLPARLGPMDTSATQVDSQTLLLATDAEEVLGREDGSAGVATSPHLFAAITDSKVRASVDEALAVVTEVRMQIDKVKAVHAMGERDAPRFDSGWDAATMVALTAERPLLDAAQRGALRRWVLGGGSLVVFADLVDNAAMQELFGADWNVSVVDRVSLTEIDFEAGRAARRGSIDVAVRRSAALGHVETEQPIVMARVVAPGWEELVRVRGWPALLRRDFGRGEVVVVAVGGRAWTDAGAEKALGQIGAVLLPTSEAMAMGVPTFSEAVVEGVAQRGAAGPGSDGGNEAARPGDTFVAGQINYEVASRGSVAVVLALLIAVLIGAGWYFQRQGRGEWLGAAGGGAAVLATVALVGIGQAQRGDLQPTVSTVQVVEAWPGMREARVSALMGLYQTSDAPLTLSSGSGGRAWPRPMAQVGTDVRRLELLDLEAWRWKALPVPAHVPKPIEFEQMTVLGSPLRMRLRYAESGLVGEIDWPTASSASGPRGLGARPGGPMPIDDVLLRARGVNMAVNTEQAGATTTVTIGPDDVLAEGVYTKGLGIGERSQDRAAMLKSALSSSRPFDRAMLLAWSAGVEVGVQTDPPLPRRTSALWTTPLTIERSSAGEKVTVPWPLVAMQPMRDANQTLGLAMLPLYREGMGQWIDRVPSASAFLARFEAPAEVMPLKLTSAKVHLDLTAINRPVRVLLVREGQVEVVSELDSPDGSTVIDLPIERVAMDAEGGVLLAFDVGPVGGVDPTAGPRKASQSQMWSVRRFGLELSGEVMDRGGAGR